MLQIGTARFPGPAKAQTCASPGSIGGPCEDGRTALSRTRRSAWWSAIWRHAEHGAHFAIRSSSRPLKRGRAIRYGRQWPCGSVARPRPARPFTGPARSELEHVIMGCASFVRFGPLAILSVVSDAAVASARLNNPYERHAIRRRLRARRPAVPRSGDTFNGKNHVNRRDAHGRDPCRRDKRPV